MLTHSSHAVLYSPPFLKSGFSAVVEKLWIFKGIELAHNDESATMNLWKQVLDRLEQTIDRTQFETWFVPTRFLAQKGDTIDVSVPSQRFVSEIRQNYAQQIRSILDEMSTDHLNLHLVADTEGSSEINIPLGPPPTDLPLSIFNPRYRFETFVVGKSNELAFAASKRSRK